MSKKHLFSQTLALMLALLMTASLVQPGMFVKASAAPAEEDTNVALQKPVTVWQTENGEPAASDPNRPTAMAADGIVGDANGSADGNYADFSLPDTDGDGVKDPGSSYLQIDLQGVFAISRIMLHRYWNDGRTYSGTVIAVGENLTDFADGSAKVLYNSDKENVHGFGKGQDVTYAETKDGKEISAADAVEARFVRIYMSGSNAEYPGADRINHIVECQVFGHKVREAKLDIQLPTGENFTVSPAEGYTTQVEMGKDFGFTVIPEDKFYVSGVTVDGTELEPVDGVYTIRAIKTEPVIEVTVEAYPDLDNLALGKKVTVGSNTEGAQVKVNPSRPESMAVDGKHPEDNSDANYVDFWLEKDGSAVSGSAYAQVDLKARCEIANIHLYRYWGDGRQYNGTTIVAADEEADFADPQKCTVLYNSDKDNVHGFGAGKEALYNETNAGKVIDVSAKKVNARFIRVYMQGNANGPQNHIVELEVNGFDFGPKPYKAKAFDNTGNHIDLPTHYDKYFPADPNADPAKHVPGQVTHPDIVKIEEGFGGHKYWMFYTPNVMKTSQFENPYIVYSDDGIHWTEPVDENGNTINPIVKRATKPTDAESHNCDTDIVYDRKNKRLMAYWNWSHDGHADAQVRMKVSYDGIHWEVPKEGKEVVDPLNGDKYAIAVRDTKQNYTFLSPTVTYDTDKDMYFMYYNNAGTVGYNNGQANKLQVQWSKDGVNWSEDVRTAINFLSKDQNGDQLAPWHQDIQYIPEKHEYWALSQCFAGGSPDGSVLYLTKSKDGIHWQQVGNQPVLTPNDAPYWNDFQIYRSTFLYDAKTDTMDIWYSALQTTPADGMVADSKGDLTIKAGTDDSRIWRIGHTSNKMPEVYKALTQNEFYEEPGHVASAGFMMKAENNMLDVGQSTDVTLKWAKTGGYADGGTAAPNNYVSDMNVKFTSSDEAVATVDPWGRITAVGDGQAIITGVTAEGSETEILITVGKQIQKAPRHVIDAEHPLYISNYYWSDGAPVEKIDDCDAGRYPESNYITTDENGNRTDRDDPLKLWNSIPDDLKDNTVVLLIAERSIKDFVIEEGTEDTQAIRNWYKQQVEFCNAHKIPCAVQNLNGETSTYDRIPLSFWKELADNNEYFVGFNGAELYNCFSEGSEVNNADEYVADLIRLGAAEGISMMWTDTNVFGKHGVLMDWLEKENSPLASAMLDNHQYVSMMYKESYGDPDTDALYLGLWLAGYCDNWGVASDWWHWQLDSNNTMFDAPGNLGGWCQTLVWPENMYSQDIIRVASMGATCYKSEPQWYSVASNGHRTPAYQYTLMPTLQKICSGEIKVPTREEVAKATKLVVKGVENLYTTGGSDWNGNAIAGGALYDTSLSQLYPKTGRYGIVPVVPNNVDTQKLLDLGFTTVVEEKLTKEMLDKVYPDEKYTGNAWAEHRGNTWYLMNSSEDKDIRQNATVTTALGDVDFSMTPHTYAVTTEDANGGLDVILSNYRLDKSELWNGNPKDSMSAIYQYIWEMSDRMEHNKGRDTELRDTVITVKTQEKPVVTFLNEGENLYAYDNYTRPFTHTQVTGEAGNWTVTVSHNGFVELSIHPENYEHTHKGVLVEATEPTCTDPGSKAYYKCSCGKFFEDAACTKEIADLDAWKEIPAKGHSFGDWVITKAPTEAEKGTRQRECSACHQVEVQDVPRLVAESIAVTKEPSKTKYKAGEDFDPAGMEVTVTYADGTKKVVENFEVLGGTDLTVVTDKLVVSYTTAIGDTKTTFVSITVTDSQVPVPSEPEETTKPEGTAKPADPDTPAKTGDTMALGLMIALVVSSLAAIVVILFTLGRRRHAHNS